MRPTTEPSRIRILYLDHTSKMGGGEVALLNMAAALDRSRFEPLVLLGSEGPLVGKLRAAGVEAHVLPLDRAVVNTRKDSLGWRSLLRAGQAAHCLGYAVRVARWARRHGVAVIHTNSLKADLYGGLAGRLAGIPVVWHVRDNINAEYLPAPVAAAFRALTRVVPRMVITNSASTLRVLQPRRGRETAVVYSGVAESALRAPGPAERVQVVHDGLDSGQFAGARPARAMPQEGPVVSLIGRISPWKGQHVFLRAAARVLAQHPRARFWIIGGPLFGEEEYERSLHALVEELGIGEAVTFWGFREDVPDLLARTDILVHASTLGEPFGQVVIEGMAAGKPVVATDGGALREIVVPGETGLLVGMGDADAMADAIAALLADPAGAAAMGEAGRRRVQENFTITQTARRVEAVYDHVLERGPGPRSTRGGKAAASRP